MQAAVLVALLALCGHAAADDDGLYFTESIGVGLARGELRPFMGNPLHIRLAVGARLGNLAIEPWMSSAMQLDRVGAFRGIIGGEPADGMADLASYLDQGYDFFGSSF